LERGSEDGSLTMRISLTSIVVATLATGIGGPAFGADGPATAERARSLPLEEHSTQTDLPPVLSKENWQQAVNVLPVEFVDKVKSGELKIRTRATTDLPLTPAYVEATRRNAGKARLREDGSLVGYVNGRPFPEIDAADPQAGLKPSVELSVPRLLQLGPRVGSLPIRRRRPGHTHNRILLCSSIRHAPQ
jgi:hypothetical protein